MYNPDYLIKETHALKINWLRAQLSNLPRGTIVNRQTNNHVVIYKNPDDGINKRFERSVITEEGQLLAQQVIRRKEYVAELEELERLWKKLYKTPIPTINICNEEIFDKVNNEFIKPKIILNRELFDNILPQSNAYAKDKWIEYNGINYRSIQERNIAEVLDNLKWPFKYEVTITSDNTLISCDFVILVRELERIKFLEFFGMLDNEEYSQRVKKKMMMYDKLGLIEDRDIIYIYADYKEPINTRWLVSKLNSMIIKHI